MRVADLGELALISAMRPFAAREGGDLRDDCAVLELGETRIAVTTDAQVQGVHFDAGIMSWREIGYRALAACLSDLAAAGADGVPRFLLALGVPGELEAQAVTEIYAGMAELQSETGAQLVGGDTVASAAVFLALTAIAEVTRPLGRGGARPGDLLFVSGAPGSAAAALVALRAGEPERGRLQAFLRPRPRLALGSALAGAGATACTDISDGLASELRAIAQASGVGIVLREDLLPRVPFVPREQAIDLAYRGGEDFELVFAAPPSAEARVLQLGAPDCPVTRVGEVTDAAEGVRALRGAEPRPVPPAGYVHHGGGGA